MHRVFIALDSVVVIIIVIIIIITLLKNHWKTYINLLLLSFDIVSI